MGTYIQTYDESIRPLMDKIDKVRPLLSLNNDDIIFPNVVVVGNQSSGKSTLLEALSFVELPKGNGIVTRCPLVLRLRKCNERKLYRLHDNKEPEQLDETNLNIPQYIEQETKKLAGSNKNIVEDLIELLIEDPNVRDLTVVDLPGIVHIPMKGQPGNIHEQITKLIKKYICQQGCIILCICPANVDIATAESISLAHDVDRSGERTIGVITKSDLAPDQETLVQQLLMNRHDIPHLKLGIVAVRNRSTDENISLQDAREREMAFFCQHPAASTVDPNCLGMDALISRLATLYSQHVKETFPKMRDDIHIQLAKVNKDLLKLPPNLETNAARLAAYNESVDLYIEKILKPELMGAINSEHISMVNVLHQKFKAYQNIIKDQKKELFSTENILNVQKELSKRSGEELPNFLCSSILKHFICEKLNQLWDVTEKLINECFRTTKNLLSKRANDSCKDNILLSKLINLFQNITDSYINESKTAVHNELRTLLELDQNDPYTLNNYYMNIIEKYKEPLVQNDGTTTKKVPITEQVLQNDVDDDDELIFHAMSTDQQAVKQMLISIYSYWYMLTKRFIDYVTLSIRAKCVFNVCPNIKQRLRQISIDRCDLIDTCLADDSFIRYERQRLNKKKATLEKAYAILCEDDKTVINENYTCIDLLPMGNNVPMTFDPYSLQLRNAGDKDSIFNFPTLSTISLPRPAQVAENSPATKNEKETTNNPTLSQPNSNQPFGTIFGGNAPNFPSKKK